MKLIGHPRIEPRGRMTMNRVALVVGCGVFLVSVSVFILICFLVADFVGKTTDPVSAVANCASAAATLLAAFSALHIAGQQRRDEAEKRADELIRRNHAARAILSISLLSICDYIERCVDLIRESGGQRAIDIGLVPSFPMEALPNFRECLEFASNLNRRKLAKALENLQLFDSRMRSLVEQSHRGSLTFCIDQILADAVSVYHMFYLLFLYARDLNGEHIAAFDGDELYLKALGLGIADARHPGVYQKIEQGEYLKWNIV